VDSAEYEKLEYLNYETKNFLGSIVYSRYETESNIFSVDGHTLNEINLSTNLMRSTTNYFMRPKWSGDGEYVLFSGDDRNSESKLFIVSANGKDGKSVPIVNRSEIRLNIYKILDRENVEVCCTKSNPKMSHIISIKSGKTIKQIAAENLNAQMYPDKLWNNDRTKYVRFGYGPYKVEIYDSDGKLLKKLGVGNTGSLKDIYSWSPDSRYLLYCEGCATTDVPDELRLLSVDTGESYYIAHGSDADWHYEISGKVKSVSSIFLSKKYNGDREKYSIEYLQAFIGNINIPYHSLAFKSLRNEIFARHGRQFKSPELQYIYGVTDWYNPEPKYSDDMLNDIERKNVQFILDYEKKMGWR
jgi:hypothetical protein